MAVTVYNYNQFLKQLGDGTLDMDSHTFKIALMGSSFTYNAANTVWANVSPTEIANGNGYTTGGQALTSVTYNQSAGVVSFDFDNPEWVAAGGDIAGVTDAVIYNDTVAGDPLMFAIDLGGTFTAVAGARLVLQLPPTGFFTIQRTV